MDKWAQFNSVPHEAWTQEATGNGGSRWTLEAKWIQYYFEGAYQSVMRDTSPENTLRAVVFVRTSQISEVMVRGLRPPVPAAYSFEWGLADFQRGGKEINRAGQGNHHKAKVSAWPGNPNILRIECSPLDETINFDLQTLAISLEESVQEKETRLDPWKRLLQWYAKLQTADPATYERVPAPIRGLLQGSAPAVQDWSGWEAFFDVPLNFAAAAATIPSAQPWNQLTWPQLEQWQREKLLPPELPFLPEPDLPGVYETIRLLVQLANDPQRQPGTQINPMYIPQIPGILRHVPEQLDILDLKCLMTMGAVREVWGHRERAKHALVQKRPELRALVSGNSPEGWELLQQDREYQLIDYEPESVKQQEQDLEAQQHRKGDFGPTPFEKMRATDQQNQWLMAQMNAETQQLESMAGSMFGGFPGMPAMPPLPPPPPPNPFFVLDPPPAWRVYKPFCI
jgi:hypothetical protein